VGKKIKASQSMTESKCVKEKRSNTTLRQLSCQKATGTALAKQHFASMRVWDREPVSNYM